LDQHTYLIRYGVMGHVGRFPAPPECATRFERGVRVVIQSDRGLELGEVLISLDGTAAARGSGATESAPLPGTALPGAPAPRARPRVLRMAGPDDVMRSLRALEARSDRFALCQRVLREEDWPWELIDVEPLLDGRSAVIHYLGPAQIDAASLRARFRVAFDLEVVLEPVGSDPDGDLLDAMAGSEHDRRAGGCGTCGCGEGGGCGAKAALESGRTEEADSSESPHDAHDACASCGIKKLLAARKPAMA
jgi:hypothetical protein